MIKDREFLIFGDDWGRLPSTIQHFGRVLSQYNTVIWVGSLGHRRPTVSFSDFKRLVQKGRSMIKNNATGSIDQGRITFVNPFVIPLHDSRIFRAVNSAAISRHIRTTLKQLNVGSPIVLTSSPVVAMLVGQLGESTVHYLCLDDNTRFDGAFKSLGMLEHELVSKADTSHFISDILLQSRGQNKATSYFLPQGVELSHFVRPGNAGPRKLDGSTRPVVGYHGLIASYVDVALIEICARAYPNYEFMIIGRSEVEFPSATTPANVNYIGPVPYKELPAYVARFDVGMIPFIPNELTLASNPLKLLEYFAMGIPVVSTALPEVAKFGDLVSVGSTHEEFIAAIQSALHSDSEELQRARIQKAQQYSWETIVENVCTHIEEAEINKGNRVS